MPNLTLSIPHQLGRAEAKRRIQEQLSQFEQQYGGMLGHLQQTWEGDTLNFSVGAAGQTVSGHAAVADDAVNVEVALPWMLSMLAGTVKQQLEQKGRNLLEHR